MEIKQGASDVPLFIQPRVDSVVLTMADWEALYGGTSGTFTLICETADKSGTEEIIGVESTNGMTFILPSTMFETAQRTWICTLQFLINGVTDFSLYHTSIDVTKGESPNSR